MENLTIKISSKESTTKVAIGGPITVQQIQRLRNVLLGAFCLGKNVQVSLDGVTEVDVAGLQLLCSAHRTSIACELDFAVNIGRCQALSSVSKVAGMLRHIGCPQDICGTCLWKRSAVAASAPAAVRRHPLTRSGCQL